MDHLRTKFEGSGAKHFWVISCTRGRRPTWPLTLTFDLLTWISIGIVYSSKTIYLPSLKLLGQSVLELSVAQGIGDQHDLWPSDLNIDRDHLLIMDYLPTKFEVNEARGCWIIGCTSCFFFGGGGATDGPTTCAKQYAPYFFRRGAINMNSEVWSLWGLLSALQLWVAQELLETKTPTSWKAFLEGGWYMTALSLLIQILCSRTDRQTKQIL